MNLLVFYVKFDNISDFISTNSKFITNTSYISIFPESFYELQTCKNEEYFKNDYCLSNFSS